MARGGLAFDFTASFTLADEVRRQGGLVLDLVVPRPGETPYRVVLQRPGITLRAYGDADSTGPALVMIPAPIKRAYIWDLAPTVSVVRKCVRAGFRVYLVEWTDPGPAAADFGLAAYADRLIVESLDVVGEPSMLVGHSLGGTLAAIFSSLHPGRVRGLVLLEAPLRFGEASGAFAPFVGGTRDGGAIAAAFGNIPGSLLSAISVTAAPATFLWRRWADWLASLTDPAAMRTHLQVERWSLDEFQMPGGLFEDVVDRLYRDDAFMKGTLRVGEKTASAGDVTAPALGVFDPQSEVVPPGAVVPFFDTVQSGEKRVLRYDGDTGVALAHVGVLVGRNAHRQLWPEILAWLRER